MKLTITTNQQQLAILQIVEPESNKFSFIKHLPLYIKQTAPNAPEVQIVIAKHLLATTYHYNPSLLARQLKSLLPSFQKASGHYLSGEDDNKILLCFSTDADAPRLHKGGLSIKQQIRQAMDESLILEILIKDIPPSYLCRPEQLTYQVKRETGHQIQISKTTKKWKIQLRK